MSPQKMPLKRYVQSSKKFALPKVVTFLFDNLLNIF